MEANEMSSTNPRLPERNWEPSTYIRLQAFLDQHFNEPQKNNYAIFDWDNTCSFNDTAEALLLFQIDNLEFKLNPDELYETILKGVPKDKFLYTLVEGGAVNSEMIAKDILDCYTYIYRNYQGFDGDKSLASIRNLGQFKSFKAKLYFLYNAINDTFGVEIGYVWITFLLANMTSDEVLKLTTQAVDYYRNEVIALNEMESSRECVGVAGVIKTSVTVGYRMNTEMIDLINLLRVSGVQVYICSASFEDIIKAVACQSKYGYNIPEDNIIALKLEKDEKGRLKAESKRDYPITVKEGKSEAIRRFLLRKHGCQPILVAGDSDGDYNMMVDFEDTELVLIINRLKRGKIGALAQDAVVGNLDGTQCKYALQGRDENSGVFIPYGSTVKYGEREKRFQ